MATYTVTVLQTLTGYVDIQADSAEEAHKLAEERFCANGEQLPEMEDLDELEFEVQEKMEANELTPCKHFSKYGEFGGCSCNNDPDEQGECIYKDGRPSATVQVKCEYYC